MGGAESTVDTSHSPLASAVSVPARGFAPAARGRGCGDGGLFFRAPDQNETVVIDGLPFMIMSLEGESLLIVRGIGEKSPPRVRIPAHFSP